MSAGLEVRTAAISRLECRTANGVITFEGLASSTDHDYDMGSFVETVRRGAFTDTLSRPGLDVCLLCEHAGLPISRTTNGSLTLTETGRGLEYVGTASADDHDAANLARKIKAGLVTEGSMAFRVTDQYWNADRTRREIKSLDLHRGDVSICAMGANPKTSSTARALARRRPYPLELAQARLRVLKLRTGAWE